MIRTIAGFAGMAAVAAGVLSGGPAQAAWTGPSPSPRPAHTDYTPTGELKLTYMAESGYATEVTLTCNPNGGGHPDPATACDTLAGIGADPGKMAPAHTMCMMIYAPITAEITGTWRGKPVTWVQKFGNSCEMTRATGMLFKF
jgi:hypothetical protein